ncbi:SPOSA6832_03941 [Sporobolomyces salmonicolor]|uniref:SPOSA6832_03941-mRNA-1:cds n=1 Tax=Sporidiobolus salmonicolor TaxID=5005 RepID=A0A0D6EQ38_SPOSA|nr:SPOSA6832_03941 [Sporobolomyces salmonicolor]
MESLYGPPLACRSNRPGYSASQSASGSAPLQQTPSRRQSRSSFPTGRSSTNPTSTLSDGEQDPSAAQEPLIDLDHVALPGSAAQDPADAAADRKLWREGRQSKQQLLKEGPSWQATGDMEQFMAQRPLTLVDDYPRQLYDPMHATDALENDVDEIVSLRNKVNMLKPSEDLGQESLRADLDSLAALTTQSGRAIVSLETWLLQLHKWSKDVKKLVRSGQAGETMKEVGEIKFQLANAKLDFADAMERIRKGAYKEQERRERTRIWMARHIRAREPDIDDHDVKGLLIAAELGAADGVQASDVTCVELHDFPFLRRTADPAPLLRHGAGLTQVFGLFRARCPATSSSLPCSALTCLLLADPFTELAELTNGMRFLHDDLGSEIVRQVAGKSQKKRVIYLNGVYSKGLPKKSKSKKSKSSSPSSKNKKESKSKSSTVVPSAPAQWFGSRFGFISTMRSHFASGAEDEYERNFRYTQAEQYAAQKDLEYGFARQEQLDRTSRRKKMVIALLLVIIAALILFIGLTTIRIPSQQVTWTSSSSSSLPWPSMASVPSSSEGALQAVQTQPTAAEAATPEPTPSSASLSSDTQRDSLLGQSSSSVNSQSQSGSVPSSDSLSSFALSLPPASPAIASTPSSTVRWNPSTTATAGTAATASVNHGLWTPPA